MPGFLDSFENWCMAQEIGIAKRKSRILLCYVVIRAVGFGVELSGYGTNLQWGMSIHRHAAWNGAGSGQKNRIGPDR